MKNFEKILMWKKFQKFLKKHPLRGSIFEKF